jgi:hypothetical protein
MICTFNSYHSSYLELRIDDDVDGGPISSRPEEDVRIIEIDVNVWGASDDIEVNMETALVCWCIVLVVGVISAVIGVCVMAGNDASVMLSSMFLGGMNKVLLEVILVGILLVNMKTAVLADPLHG